jgi:hypothetical protein
MGVRTAAMEAVWAAVSEKLRTIAEVIADARTAVMNPRRRRRHLTCATCGQMYDRTDSAQVEHHHVDGHSKWAP